MPIYENVATMDYYPHPETRKRELFSGLEFESVLDVGAGHGGVFDIAFWENKAIRKEACDIFWMREHPKDWKTTIGVNVLELDKFYGENEFDFVQCTEVLEHVEDSRLALEQLVRVAKKAVFITSADEVHHVGEEQDAIEKFNKYQAYVKQPKIEDLVELGFEVRVDSPSKRQIIAWLIK
jgi:SAM-dependent methyltransferase